VTGPADERTLRVLEFPKIIEVLSRHTVTPMGRERALRLLPASHLDEMRERLAVVGEAVALVAEAEIPVRGGRDLTPYLAHAASGGSLEPTDLLEVLQTLEVIRHLHGHVRGRRSRAPRLAEIADRLTPLPEIEAQIERALDTQGRIKDDASPELRRLRTEQRDLERRLRTSLDAIVHGEAHARYLQEPIITTRGDRYVVPVKAEHRAQFPGIVHDSSASGATLFMEPLSLVPLGNRRRELAAAEREEIRRILQRLSALIAQAAPALRQSRDAMAEIDLAAAGAALAAALRAAPPAVSADGVLRLRGARHPLLVLTRGADSVVPIDIELGGAFTTLVITGPNTGGKTVALKTAGLLVLMAQAGLHIPADDGSQVTAFAQVHADIGDEQSIEQNLSTFSSHLTAIVEILRRVEPPALVLLDEVGAGTDPTEGVALARAIILTLYRRGLYTAVTTHYNELKMLASGEHGIENGSVEFDGETLRPTYRLRIGLPGRSNALIIAERLGLAPEIVADARAQLAPEQVAIERVLEDLTRDRQAAEHDRAEAALARQAAEDAEQRWATEADRLRAERRRLLAEARRASEAIVEETRRRLDAVLAEVRAAGSEAAVQRARAHLREVLEALPPAEPAPVPGPLLDRVEPGQAVFVAPLGRAGVVRAAPDARDEVEVEVGAVRTRVPRSALRGVEPIPQRPDEMVQTPDVPAVAPSLSVRGATVDDALLEVDRYLDEAVRARLPQVSVIHGKGTGRLRRALHDFLRGHPHVRQFRLGERGEGDEGATVITLAL